MYSSKTCNKCFVDLPLTEFYRAATTADGYRGNCKRCQRSYVNDYAKTDRGKEVIKRSDRKMKKERPEKFRARAAVKERVRRGTLTRLPCEVCGTPVTDAHHEDYSRPLDVKWLCELHHRERHRELGTKRGQTYEQV